MTYEITDAQISHILNESNMIGTILRKFPVLTDCSGEYLFTTKYLNHPNANFIDATNKKDIINIIQPLVGLTIDIVAHYLMDPDEIKKQQSTLSNKLNSNTLSIVSFGGKLKKIKKTPREYKKPAKKTKGGASDQGCVIC